MTTRSRFRIAGLLLLTVGILSVPAISQAHKRTYATTVTAAAQNKNQVDGNVHSAKLRCLPERTVSLYSPTGVFETSVVTDAQGSFRIPTKNLAAGVHYVNVKKRLIQKNRRHTHRCGAAQTTVVIA